MKRIFIFISLLPYLTFAQSEKTFQFESNKEYPYGRLNPMAPTATGDFQDLIGLCNCKSVSRNPDQTWADTLQMTWKWKYIMNGYAVQDEVWQENEFYAGSIRQYHADSSRWVVTYYSYPGIAWNPASWHGTRIDSGDIVLYNPQKAPNGMDGFYKIRFYNISDEGFNWRGEWVNPDESIVYPTWMIFCKKVDP